MWTERGHTATKLHVLAPLFTLGKKTCGFPLRQGPLQQPGASAGPAPTLAHPDRDPGRLG